MVYIAFELVYTRCVPCMASPVQLTFLCFFSVAFCTLLSRIVEFVEKFGARMCANLMTGEVLLWSGCVAGY